VEIAMVIDVWQAVGLEGMAQVDLDVHRNRHQPLQALAPMAYTVLATIARRLVWEGRLHPLDAEALAPPGGLEREPVPERPPWATVGVA
jgi:glucosyl-3-phosphoglycerate synthase